MNYRHFLLLCLFLSGVSFGQPSTLPDPEVQQASLHSLSGYSDWSWNEGIENFSVLIENMYVLSPNFLFSCRLRGPSPSFGALNPKDAVYLFEREKFVGVTLFFDQKVPVLAYLEYVFGPYAKQKGNSVLWYGEFTQIIFESASSKKDFHKIHLHEASFPERLQKYRESGGDVPVMTLQ